MIIKKKLPNDKQIFTLERNTSTKMVCKWVVGIKYIFHMRTMFCVFSNQVRNLVLCLDDSCQRFYQLDCIVYAHLLLQIITYIIAICQ